MKKSSQETQNEKGVEHFNFETREIISVKEYVEAASSHAIESGWIKLEQKETFVQQYLLPSYRKYREIIDEVKRAIVDEPEAEAMMGKIILWLNLCLEKTKRIGSTDPDNIMRAIGDIYRMRATDNNYMEYALASLKEHVQHMLNQ